MPDDDSTRAVRKTAGAHLAALRHHERVVHLCVVILTVCLVAGLNLMVAGLSDGAASPLSHAIVSLTPVAGYLVGTRLRDRQVGGDNRRLLARLARLHEALAGGAGE